MTQPSSPDPFEFLKALWAPMGLPMGGMVAPILDTAELDKRIADLKSVENWLTMNLNVLKMSIQGLEMQRATLAAMRSAAAAAAEVAPAAGAGPSANAVADAWLNMFQAPAKPPEPEEPKK